MRFSDDDLTHLLAHGVPALPVPDESGWVESEGVRIWFWVAGAGPVVALLHGGMGNGTNFARQVPALLQAGYRVVLVDARAQGRSGWDGAALSYRQMARDVLAVFDELAVERAAIVGWSDGAVVGLEMARQAQNRVAGVFFFACNVDDSGTLPFEMTPVIGRILEQHKRDYAAFSPTPDGFDRMEDAVGLMQRTQPDYSAADIATIAVPVTVAIGEDDEFILPAHLRQLADTLPQGEFRLLEGVSHFAPLQRPALFNGEVLRFLRRVHG